MNQTITVDVRFLLGLLGSSFLAIGVFVPIVRLPIIGTVNYFRNGEGDGVIVLILAVVSLILVTKRMYRWLWLTSAASIGVLGFTLVNLISKISEVKEEMNKQMAELGDNPFRGLAEGLADAAMGTVQIEWGWVVLASGVALVMLCAGMKDKAGDVSE